MLSISFFNYSLFSINPIYYFFILSITIFKWLLFFPNSLSISSFSSISFFNWFISWSLINTSLDSYAFSFSLGSSIYNSNSTKKCPTTLFSNFMKIISYSLPPFLIFCNVYPPVPINSFLPPCLSKS